MKHFVQVLDLSPEREACINYRIGRLPPGIGNLSGLRVLMLDTNELDVLPSEICLLTMLEKLSLSNNFIRTLPDGFNQLRRLESLYMANNRIDKVLYLVICNGVYTVVHSFGDYEVDHERLKLGL